MIIFQQKPKLPYTILANSMPLLYIIDNQWLYINLHPCFDDMAPKVAERLVIYEQIIAWKNIVAIKPAFG